MPDKSIYFDDIGIVSFRKNRRSKNISISIRPLKGVVVTLPYYSSYKFAAKVVERKKDWILKQLPKIAKIENEATIFTEETIFKTRYRQLQLKKNQDELIKTRISNDSIHVLYPNSSNVEDTIDFYKRFNEKMEEFIVKSTRITKEKLKEKKRHEWFLTSEEMLELGIVEEII